MSAEFRVSDLPLPMATPRLTVSDLPDVPSAPTACTSITTTSSSPISMTRKQAREDRHLQYLEEERLDDERALHSITSQVITLRLPFEAVKMEFEDLDGLSHSPPSSRLLRSPPPPRLDTVLPHVPAASAVHHIHSIPPLTPDATIRAAVSASRRYLPSVFKAPGSPQLEAALSRKSSRRAAGARRRASAERERMCRPGSSA